MKLWEDFISHACSTGVIINDICYTQWTRTIITDACEHGIGGFCVETDRAWRYRLPPELIGRLHINIIEFCASVIGIWVELNEYAGPHPRFMTLFDSTSVLGWLHKSNFNPTTHKRHDIVARKLARLLLKHEASIYSQHIAGKSKCVADSLSRYFHIPTEQHSLLLTYVFPSLVPQNFHIMDHLP